MPFRSTKTATKSAPEEWYECTRYPYDNWLRVLLLTTKLPYDDIARIIHNAKFPVPTEEYVERVRRDLLAKKPPRNFQSAAGRTWLRVNRLYGLVLGTDRAREARDLLHDYRLRNQIEALLIAWATTDEILDALAVMGGRRVHAKTIELYRHYFWDYSEMALADTYGFFSMYQDVNGARLRAFLGRGVQHAMWKMGYVVEVPSDIAVKTVYAEAFHRFNELRTFPNGQDTALAAQLWSNQLFRALEHQESNSKGLEQAANQLSGLSLKLGTRDISSIDSIRTLDAEKA